MKNKENHVFISKPQETLEGNWQVAFRRSNFGYDIVYTDPLPKKVALHYLDTWGNAEFIVKFRGFWKRRIYKSTRQINSGK